MAIVQTGSEVWRYRQPVVRCLLLNVLFLFHIAPMRFTPEHLTYKALCAVSEIVEQSAAGPVKPSMALRFALAFLYVQSGKQQKWVYDQFWQRIQDEYPHATCAEQAGYFRSRDAQGCLNAMVEGNKMPMTPAFFQSLRDSHIKRQDLTKPS